MLALMSRKVREVPEFARAVRERFDAVLIDEFQDTDSVQYAAFHELFLQGENRPRHVIFVGDPKQAIYRFRRAELETYIRARNDIGPGNVYTLENNYRTTRALIDVFNLFFGSGDPANPSRSFFSDDILYRPVGCGNREKGITAALHNQQFDVDERCIPVGIELQLNILMELLTKK